MGFFGKAISFVPPFPKRFNGMREKQKNKLWEKHFTWREHHENLKVG
jgi:hypothetical protein